MTIRRDVVSITASSSTDPDVRPVTVRGRLETFLVEKRQTFGIGGERMRSSDDMARVTLVLYLDPDSVEEWQGGRPRRALPSRGGGPRVLGEMVLETVPNVSAPVITKLSEPPAWVRKLASERQRIEEGVRRIVRAHQALAIDPTDSMRLFEALLRRVPPCRRLRA